MTYIIPNDAMMLFRMELPAAKQNADGLKRMFTEHAKKNGAVRAYVNDVDDCWEMIAEFENAEVAIKFALYYEQETGVKVAAAPNQGGVTFKGAAR